MSDRNGRSVFGPYDDCSSGEPSYGDPLEIYRVLQVHTGGQLNRVVQDARQRGPADAPGDSEETLAAKAKERAKADNVAFPAIECLMGAVRAAFKMAPFDRKTGMGATEMDCHRALNAFFLFLSESKKNTGT